MKHKIIRINEISEIDTSAVTIYDLNNRYIDIEGNMYGLRYNRMSKKIEIIRILRTHINDAPFYQQRLLEKKIIESRAAALSATDHAKDEKEDLPDDEIRFFDPNSFINETIALMQTHRERLKGIMMNIKNANIISLDDKAESSEMDDVFRTVEIDAVQKMEEVENYQKELINYPRSITYYQAKTDRQGREVIDRLAGDNQRILKFIYLYEMYHSIRGIYTTVYSLINKIREFVDEKKPDETVQKQVPERQAYNDALISIENTVRETEDLLDRLKTVEEYLYDSSNY